MRGSPGRLTLRLLLVAAQLAALPACALAQRVIDSSPYVLASYRESIRRLDGDQFLEDEPVWLCNDAAPIAARQDAWASPPCALVGRDANGVPRRYFWNRAAMGMGVPRAFEVGQTFGYVDPSGRAPLWGEANGLPEGAWEIRPAHGDTARTLARIRVLAPRGSERSVRDALARAARLAQQLDRPKDAAELYAAIYQRYPRTAYLSVIYWGQWGVREHTRFAQDPGRWMEEVFAHFHDTCFGVVALDRWVADVGLDEARPVLRTLIGIYPDTDLSRAALRYF